MRDYTEYLKIDEQKWYDLQFKEYTENVAVFRTERSYGMGLHVTEDVYYTCSEECLEQLKTAARQELADKTREDTEDPWRHVSEKVYFRGQLVRPVADGASEAQVLDDGWKHVPTDTLHVRAIFSYSTVAHPTQLQQVGTHLVQITQVEDKVAKYGPMKKCCVKFLDGIVRNSQASVTLFPHTKLWRRVADLGERWIGEFGIKNDWLQLVAAHPLDASAAYWL